MRRHRGVLLFLRLLLLLSPCLTSTIFVFATTADSSGSSSSSSSGGVSCVVAGGSEKTIPASYVNDDYCDCVKSGEDEYATPACAHVIKQFVCEKNVDKKAISFAFVKDKVCDCCDGSDEVLGACQDTCDKERNEEIARVKTEMELHLKGEVEKKGYSKLGTQGVKQMDSVIKQLRQEVKLGEEELQAKIYSQPNDQKAMQQLYMKLLQKGQHLRTLETLSSSPSSFGPKREYFPLLGKCYALRSNEKHFKGGSFENVAKDFLFEICPFDRVSQVGVEAGDKPTLLGSWQEWKENKGKGKGKDKDKDMDNVMIYSGGDECWNGPPREVEVLMQCGEEDKLVDVRENGKCTYEFIFATPAACSKKHADKLKRYLKRISPEEQDTEKDGITHDEL